MTVLNPIHPSRTSFIPALGLDVGRVRVGLAVVCTAGGHVEMIKTVPRRSDKALQEVLTAVSRYNVKTVVVGLPLNAHKEKTLQCEDVERFARRISKRTGASIQFVDEYLSSVEAARETSDGPIDGDAAAVILRRFLSGEDWGVSQDPKEE